MKTYTFDQLKKKMTEKERIFCHQYIVDWNGARSAREAGYSMETAKQIACENLTKPYIQQYIAFIKNNLEEEAGISKLRNIQELTKIAYSTFSRLYDSWIELANWEEIKENTPELLSIIESIDFKTEHRSFKTDGGEEQDIEVKYVKVKLYSKLQAIELINKMMGYNLPVKSDLTTNGKELPSTSIILTKEEVKRISDILENEC